MNEESRALRDLYEQRSSLTQAEFGKAHEIGSAPMVWQYLNGKRRLNLKVACKFARGLQVPLADISPRLDMELRQAVEMAGLSKEIGQKPVPPQSEYAQIPRVVLDLSPHMRAYKVRQASVAAFIAFRNDWLKERGYAPAKLMAVECPDGGMESTMSAGDLVVLNTAIHVPQDGEAFALNYEGRLQIRRMVRDDGDWWLACDSSDKHRYPRKRFSEKQCFIIAKVVYRQSEKI